jgi:hypothetical protein
LFFTPPWTKATNSPKENLKPSIELEEQDYYLEIVERILFAKLLYAI